MDVADIKKLFEKSLALKDIEVRGATLLKGDASPRRYTRIVTNGSSLIMMELDDGAGPAAEGGITLLQRETFPLVQEFLSSRGIAVPKIVANFPTERVLIVEDVGDVSLGRLVRDPEARDVCQIKQALGSNPIRRAYELAIDEMIKLQSLPSENHFVFVRQLSGSSLMSEARRFIEMYAEPQGASGAQVSEFESELQFLCNQISDFPLVLSHRDFMPMNIHFKPDGSVVLIDFQDMCLAPQGYDLCSLLTDRDFDHEIGDALIRDLLTYTAEKIDEPLLEKMYNLSVLQRNLRLIGQFTKLSQTRAPMYGKFVPGCIARTKSILERLQICPAIHAYLK